MDFINEGKTGKVKLYDIYEAIYEDCDSALADDFYKGLKPKMNQKKNIDLADAEVQLYIRDFLESHENDYQYDLLKQALEPYYDHEYDLADEDVQESYEVLEEDDSLEENATFEEIIYRMECAEIYEDLYNAAMLISNSKLQTEVTKLIQQCEEDGDDVEEAYSIVTSDLLDMHINDKNVESFEESEKKEIAEIEDQLENDKTLKGDEKVDLQNDIKYIEDIARREKRELTEEENPQEFEYRLLSRLKSDCDYYLGNGNRNAEHCLWAKNEQGQIDKMREIYNQLKEKPEWLSEEDINNYAKEMGVVDLPSTTDGTAEKEIQDMLDRSEKRSKENLDESKDGFNRNELIAVKNSIDTALDDLQILSNGTTGAMEDKVLVNDLRNVSQSVGSYLNRVNESKDIKEEANGQAPDFKVDFEGDMTIDMGYTDEEGAEKRAKELLGDVAKSTNVRDLNVDVKDVKKIEKENKELKKEDKIIWSSQYDFDGTTADEAYQEYLDEFESTPVEPKSFEEWLEDTKDIWFDAEADRYKEEHPDEIDKLSDFEIDEIDAQLRDNVEKEIEANMDDLKDQYEEYVEEFKKENNMTTPEDKERWQMSWYEQDADAQWEVKDADFTNSVFPMIESQCNDDILLLFGSVGLWNGTFDGGKMIKAEESELRKIMGDYDEVIVEADEDNHIAMKFVHHDGVHYMQLFTIPEDLTELAKAMEYEDADELYSDIVNGYVDEEELAKHPDLLVPIIDKGGNDNE